MQSSLFDLEKPWEKEWKNMPECIMDNKGPVKQLIISFADMEDYEQFSKLLGQKLTPKTQSVWHPSAEIETYVDKVYINHKMDIIKNKYPVFIPTKGRSHKPLTINTFKKLGIDFKIVIEAQDLEDYKKIVPEKDILVVPHVNEGLTKTRNWIWDYAEKLGCERFWTFDDNIDGLFRLNNNLKVPMGDATALKVIEDFADRYENLHLTGMNYFMFASRKSQAPPITFNTRVYSNMLLKTDARNKQGEKFRNNLFYNDDTDLCLRMLKDGLPIVQFNAFLIGKAQTMTIKGGMTEYYKSAECDGRKKFAEELVNAHPDVARVTWKFNRWHHEVNYKPFKRNKLIKKSDIDISEDSNNYDMVLKYINDL